MGGLCIDQLKIGTSRATDERWWVLQKGENLIGAHGKAKITALCMEYDGARPFLCQRLIPLGVSLSAPWQPLSRHDEMAMPLIWAQLQY